MVAVTGRSAEPVTDTTGTVTTARA
jgi:hypothetical protein